MEDSILVWVLIIVVAHNIWSVWCSTKPLVHKKIHKLLINMAFKKACPNFKKGLKMAFGLLRINDCISENCFTLRSLIKRIKDSNNLIGAE